MTANHARIAVGVAVTALVLGLAGVVLAAWGGDSPLKDPGVLGMNLVIATAFPAVGAVVARHQPGHRLALVFSAAGLGGAVTLFSYGYGRFALEVQPEILPGGVAAAWVAAWVWTMGVMPLVTFGLLLFPDGRLPSPRWRPAVYVAVAAIGMMALSFALLPGPLEDHPTAMNPLGITGTAEVFEVLGGLGFALFSVAFLAAIISVFVRWRHARWQERRQLRWLLYAVVIVVVAFGLDLTIPSTVTSFVIAGALGLLPVAVGIAIVREHLYDIDVLISRSLVFGALTVGVIATYVVVVAAVGGAIGGGGGLAGSLIATGIVAVAFQPARELLQRRVSRWVYGAGADPYAALAHLAQRLESTVEPTAILPTVVETVATTLRLPYVAIELTGEDMARTIAAHGAPTEDLTDLTLTHQGQVIGRMVLGRRSDGRALTRTERRLLEDLARQAGLAVHGVRLTAALQRSRQRLVLAREEERRRLHRDLHDGLGPSLAAMTLQLDVLRRLIVEDPTSAEALALQLKGEVQTAIPEIRRLVDALRPPALDELGLVSALRQQAVALSAPDSSGRGVTVVVEASDDLPRLSAATEVAAYRIAMEAMANVLRHADARRCVVRLTCNGALLMEIEDDGRGIAIERGNGVGLVSMRERAAELGGHCTIERVVGGGTLVRARLPVGAT